MLAKGIEVVFNALLQTLKCLFYSSWHGLNQSLDNFVWNFLPLFTNYSLQVRKVFGVGYILLIAFFSTIHKFSIGFRSGLCAGHSSYSMP